MNNKGSDRGSLKDIIRIVFLGGVFVMMNAIIANNSIKHEEEILKTVSSSARKERQRLVEKVHTLQDSLDIMNTKADLRDKHIEILLNNSNESLILTREARDRNKNYISKDEYIKNNTADISDDERIKRVLSAETIDIEE